MECLAQTELHGSTCYPFAIFSLKKKKKKLIIIHFLPKLFDLVGVFYSVNHFHSTDVCSCILYSVLQLYVNILMLT